MALSIIIYNSYIEIIFDKKIFHIIYKDFNKIFANIEICYENDNEDANEEVINIEKIKR